MSTEEPTSTPADEPKSTLTESQKLRIERNRLRAESLRKGKLVSHPYSLNKKDVNVPANTVVKIHGTKFVDSGGGFLVEAPLTASENALKIKLAEATTKEYQEPIVTFPITYTECLDCGDKFSDSYLFDNFGHAVCDKCRDPDEKHALITRTEAKNEFLLKDCDFDKRDPPLKYISRKNPHNNRWGEMKLYLYLQVQQRALEVWGSEEKLLEHQEEREEKREISKIKKYNKQMKQLRMDVRSSLYTKKTKVSHEHEFGTETYNEEDDTYTHVCLTCQYSETFEKM